MVMEYPAATEDRGFAESVVLTGVQFLLANDGTLCVPWREADCEVSKRMSEEGVVRSRSSTVWARLYRNVGGQRKTDTLGQSRNTARLKVPTKERGCVGVRL